MLNPPELRFDRAPAQGPPRIKFDARAGNAAAEAWGANCGPGAIAAIAGLTLDQVRPHLGDFESKGYTNPTLMYAALRSLGVTYDCKINALGDTRRALIWPRFGLVRIQWGGPWTREGVPIQARYRKTHWVGSWSAPGWAAKTPTYVFDINTTCFGGWVPFAEWSRHVVPWLLKEIDLKGWDGRWWPTHALECSVSGVKPCP